VEFLFIVVIVYNDNSSHTIKIKIIVWINSAINTGPPVTITGPPTDVETLLVIMKATGDAKTKKSNPRIIATHSFCPVVIRVRVDGTSRDAG
jgi:hypothetical protein